MRSSLTKQAQLKADEERDQAEETIGYRTRLARRERASAITAAGEAGVDGQSFALQLKDSLFQQDLDTAAISKNQGIRGHANQAVLDGQYSQTPNPSAIDYLSSAAGGLSSGLQIGGQVSKSRGRTRGP